MASSVVSQRQLSQSGSHRPNLRKILYVIGVNLPIRYLIITGVYQGAERILVRDFHNLIGRAGRAGMHTEGSVIFAQNEIFDGRSNFATRWRWRTALGLLNPANAEPTASSLLLLFVPFTYGKPEQQISFDVATAHEFVFDERPRVERLVAETRGSSPNADMRAFERFIDTRIRIVQAIAAFVLAHLDFTSENFPVDAERLCTNTLAYHLASEEQRQMLQSLFHNISVLIAQQAPTSELRASIRRSALSPTSVRALTEWLLHNIDNLRQARLEDRLFGALSGQILSLTTDDALLSLSQPDEIVPLAERWMAGESFAVLHEYLVVRGIRLGSRVPKIEDVVGICEGGFGYSSAMLLSTIADLVEELDQEVSTAIGILHKRLKYGLPSKAAIAFYEAGFSDRVLSQELAQAFPDAGDRAGAVSAVRSARAATLTALSSYPAYFQSILVELLG